MSDNAKSPSNQSPIQRKIYVSDKKQPSSFNARTLVSSDIQVENPWFNRYTELYVIKFGNAANALILFGY